jgi:hypothetical protein
VPHEIVSEEVPLHVKRHNYVEGSHGWLLRRAGRRAGSRAGLAVAVAAMPDRGEPFLCGVELGGDHVLNIGGQGGVRAQGERTSGTSGPYLRTSYDSFGPVVSMMPTALSARSEALITRAYGVACRLARTCSRYC